MLSSSFDISEFVQKVKGHCDEEIIYLADQEATAAERYIYKHTKCRKNNGSTENCADVRNYAVLLKDIVLYMRYGVLTRSVRRMELALPQSGER
jgi:hypothetical protein